MATWAPEDKLWALFHYRVTRPPIAGEEKVCRHEG